MAPFRCFAAIGALLGMIVMTTNQVAAITAKEVMEKMTEKERFGYVTGLIDMLSYQHVLTGNRDRAKCISDAFYGKKDETWRSLFETFGRFPDKAPEGLVIVLMTRACGS